MTVIRRFASVLLVLALVVGLAAEAGAAPSRNTARRRQEQVRAARAKKAAQVNALKASDAELERAVRTLASQVAAQGAKVAAARQAVAAAEASVKQAETKIATTEKEIGSLHGAVVGRAVEAYVRPQQSALAGLSGAENLEDASRRASMLRQVANHDRDVIDRLSAAKEDLGIEKARAEEARQVASKRREAARQQLGTLEQNLVEKARLEAALDARIKAVTGEIDALEREEAAIADRIRQASLQRASRDAAGGIDTGGRVSGAGMRWPVSGPVTSGYGYRWGRMHAGIDIGAGTGTPIRAAKAGEVIFSGSQGGYGNVVIIDHGGGLTTLYAHQSRIAARDGQGVGQGEVIGYVGSTGQSTGPHLHFETRVNGSPQNPRRYLP